MSVQLWSVNDDLKRDFKGTLEKIAKMGFNGVEFARNYGPFKKDPKGLKTYIHSLGLEVSGAHVSIQQLDEQHIDETLRFMERLGVTAVIVSMDKRAWSPKGVKELVSELNQAALKAAQKGIQIGYHNHEKEFRKYLGSTYWDYIASHTSKDVLLQLDVGWVTYAGMSPVNYVEMYPGRTLTTHYKVRTYNGPANKVSGANVIIGNDNFDWVSLIKANQDYGNTQWIVVEQEEHPKGILPIEAIELSLEGLIDEFDKIRGE
ncbi:sugar phosphate isomerase/epimerase [Paraglaciecola arctica]|nr:sugar phosphate isomerase/epimerase [Paraglaciecola arctica]